MESLAAAYVLQLSSTQPVMQTFLFLGSIPQTSEVITPLNTLGWSHASWSLWKRIS